MGKYKPSQAKGWSSSGIWCAAKSRYWFQRESTDLYVSSERLKQIIVWCKCYGLGFHLLAKCRRSQAKSWSFLWSIMDRDLNYLFYLQLIDHWSKKRKNQNNIEYKCQNVSFHLWAICRRSQAKSWSFLRIVCKL